MALSNQGNALQLPPELMREVCSHLESKDLFRVCLVNSSWAAIGTEQLWSCLSLRHLFNIRPPPRQDLRSMVKHVVFGPKDNGISNINTAHLLKFHLPNLQSITCEWQYPKKSPLLWIPTLLGASLKHLVFKDQMHPPNLMAMLREHCHNLHSLHIGSVEIDQNIAQKIREDIQHLYPLLKQCTKLVKLVLCISSPNFSLPVDVSPIIELSQLRHLDLRGAVVPGFPKSVLRTQRTPPAVMKRLHLSTINKIGAETLLPHLSGIHVLKLGLDSHSMNPLLTGRTICKTLKELTLTLHKVSVPFYREDLLLMGGLT